MFLPYAVVPVVAFAVLLNFFHLSPIHSFQCGENFTSCDACLKSPCHTDPTTPRPCTVNKDNTTFRCFKCEEQDLDGNKQFYFQDECEAKCEDKKKCVVDGSCIVCAMKKDVDMCKYKWDYPLFQLDGEKCGFIPYCKPAC